MTNLFSTYQLGPYVLKNRIVMAPLTRCRADAVTRVPTPMMTTYYEQRASAGLIITEATVIAAQGVGYPATPGIYSAEQISAWKNITEAVHKKDGRIFLQLWHCGRVSHSSFLGGALPVSSSAVAIPGQLYTPVGMQAYETPRALDISEIPGIVALYEQAARNAMQAGFDGVEIHGANGYLIDQFLRDGVNHRTDAYGGTIENRARLLLEVVEAVVRVWGKGRVGLRLSPSTAFNGMNDSDPVNHFAWVADKLSSQGLAYLHCTEGDDSDRRRGNVIVDLSVIRDRYKGTFMVCNEYDQAKAETAVANNKADLVAFGKLFIANPDLPERFRSKHPLNVWDADTFYTPGEKGYTDYPQTLTVLK